MPDLPPVSIITPSFNQAAYLEQTLCSVLAQDYPNLEYLVVDGASSDGSVEIIRKYEKCLRWWVSEPDCGQADAINKGFMRAQGEIVAWLNSDDLYLPGAVSKAVKALQDHPDWGLVFGDMAAVDENNRLINLQRFSDWELEDLMAYRIIGQPAVFMRRSILQQAGLLDTRFHFMLDHHLWLRIAALAPVGHFPDFLAAARFHAEAKNIAKAADFGRDAWEVYRWMENEPLLADSFTRRRREILAGVYWINARYFSEGGMPQEALKNFLHSLRIYPPATLRDWRRFLFTLAQLVGGERFKQVYYERRRKRQVRTLPPELRELFISDSLRMGL